MVSAGYHLAPRERPVQAPTLEGGRTGKARDILDNNGFQLVNGSSYSSVLKIVQQNRPTPV